jgi:hypothetical protein
MVPSYQPFPPYEKEPLPWPAKKQALLLPEQILLSRIQYSTTRKFMQVFVLLSCYTMNERGTQAAEETAKTRRRELTMSRFHLEKITAENHSTVTCVSYP